MRALATLHGGELSLTRGAAGGTRAHVVFPKSRALDAPLEATEKVVSGIGRA